MPMTRSLYELTYERAIVRDHTCRGQHLTIPDPAECGGQLPHLKYFSLYFFMQVALLLHLDTASAAELAQAELQQVQRPPHQQQHNQVGNQEGASKYFWTQRRFHQGVVTFGRGFKESAVVQCPKLCYFSSVTT